jgi:myo-inositol-1(or 4)-monophosphatase
MSGATITAEVLGEYLEAAREAARIGAAVLEEWRRRFKVRQKALNDLVTEADLASQRAIQQFLAERFPGHEFLGEEEGPRSRPAPDAPPTWVVDPLDGTTNYVHDCPMYCVSIGLQAVGELVVGVVYDPARREMFAAAVGLGAWLGEERLRTSAVSDLGQALLATGFPPDMRGQERALEWWRYFSLRAQSLRRTGSTALNLAYVAAGRFDGYWAFDNNAWDVAGGVVLVREAGGQVSRPDGSPFDPYQPEGVASNGPLHAVLVEALRLGPSA